MTLAPSRTVKTSLGLVAVAILVLAVGYFFLVKPVNAEASAASDETAELQAQLTSLQAQFKALQGKQNAVPEFYRLSKAAPLNVDVPGVNLELLTLADKAGVSVEAFQTSEVEEREGFSAPTFTVTYSGDFKEVTSYIKELRNLVVVRSNRVRARGNLYRFDDIDITKPDPLLDTLEVVMAVSITAPPSAPTDSGTAVSPEDDAPEGDAPTEESPDEGADG